MAALPCGPARETQSPGRRYKREPRIPRKATVVAERLTGDRSAIRVELINSSEHGLGLSTLVPLCPGMQLALTINTGALSEILRCSIRHCTKLQSGYYDVGVKILERVPGHLNTTPIPEAWLKPAPAQPVSDDTRFILH